MLSGIKAWLIACGVLAAMLSYAVSVPAQGSALLVIVHPSVKLRSLDADELNMIFTMSRKNWPGGLGVVPFNYEPSNPLRRLFDSIVLGLAPDQVSRFWIDQAIRGHGEAPRKVPSVKLMAAVIARLPGSIGYVPSGTPVPGTNVVAQITNNRVLAPAGVR